MSTAKAPAAPSGRICEKLYKLPSCLACNALGLEFRDRQNPFNRPTTGGGVFGSSFIHEFSAFSVIFRENINQI